MWCNGNIHGLDHVILGSTPSSLTNISGEIEAMFFVKPSSSLFVTVHTLIYSIKRYLNEIFYMSHTDPKVTLPIGRTVVVDDNSTNSKITILEH